MDEDTMIDLTLGDLGAAGERLYVAALRYARAFERDELDMEHRHGDGPCRVNVGNAGAMLVTAAADYGAAYQRAENSGVFEEDGEPEELAG